MGEPLRQRLPSRRSGEVEEKLGAPLTVDEEVGEGHGQDAAAAFKAGEAQAVEAREKQPGASGRAKERLQAKAQQRRGAEYLFWSGARALEELALALVHSVDVGERHVRNLLPRRRRKLQRGAAEAEAASEDFVDGESIVDAVLGEQRLTGRHLDLVSLARRAAGDQGISCQNVVERAKDNLGPRAAGKDEGESDAVAGGGGVRRGEPEQPVVCNVSFVGPFKTPTRRDRARAEGAQWRAFRSPE